MEFFRLVTSTDLDAYYEVLHQGYQSIKQLPISFEAVDASEEKTLEWILEHPTYGLFIGDTIVSALSLRMPWGSSPGPLIAPHLGWFVTHPDYKRKGYARKLYQQVEKEILSKELKTPIVTLGTAENHEWLKSMYESFGFEIYKTIQLQGKKHRTVYFKKQLSRDGE